LLQDRLLCGGASFAVQDLMTRIDPEVLTGTIAAGFGAGRASRLHDAVGQLLHLFQQRHLQTHGSPPTSQQHAKRQSASVTARKSHSSGAGNHLEYFEKLFIPASLTVIRVLFAVLVVPLVGLPAWSFLLQPLKYRYLIWRVESARTAAEESAAFRIAADGGRVWEVDRLRPEDAVADGRKLTGNWLLRLEWLDSSPFNGGAYVAYRAVTDTNSLRTLSEKKY
jgi:hypothetical protein